MRGFLMYNQVTEKRTTKQLKGQPICRELKKQSKQKKKKELN